MLPWLLAVSAGAAVSTPAADVSTARIDSAASGSRSPERDADAPPPKKRTGVVVGFSFGGGLGGASGYPNNVQRIGDPQYHSASGWMPGTSQTVLVMGALADYLNVGFWFSTSSFSSGGDHASAVGVGLRVEAFPLLVLAPRVDGLGLFGEFGFGTGSLTTPSHPKAEGTQSNIGVGAFYEWPLGHVLGGHAGFGPSLEYDTVFSQPFEAHGLVASGRVVFYGGP